MKILSRAILTFGLCLGIAGFALAQASREATLRVVGQVESPQTFTMEAFRALPHETLKVLDVHSGKTDVYEGVPLVTLLAKAGAPLGEKLRGKTMPTMLLAEATDGYRVAFALAELDAGLGGVQVLVADKVNGAPGPMDSQSHHAAPGSACRRTCREVTEWGSEKGRSYRGTTSVWLRPPLG
jgi:DMSO/TMAO reductase YedYZ molybdopterin-dependent catalytic subunit